jgi:hypothetical protein
VRHAGCQDAYVAVALNNAQGELHPLEIGWHALGFIEAGGTACDYAKQLKVPETTLADRVQAAPRRYAYA